MDRDKTEEELAYWLAVTLTPELKYKNILHWLTLYADVASIFSVSSAELAKTGWSSAEIQAVKNPNWGAVETALKWRDASSHIIPLNDADYPALLKEMAAPPLVLYVKGNKQACVLPQMAIVGSRTPTPIGIQTATRFASDLAQLGFVITSGLALGIDGASHRGALAVTGTTVAVLGTGLKHIYPKTHDRLAEEMVAQNGALVSEFPLMTSPRPENFPRRNRIISGLSLGVLVVEAALKSGSLVTARYALEQGREVFAIPGSIHLPTSQGCHYLIRQGAKLVEKVEHIIEELKGWNHIVASPLKKSVAELDLTDLNLPNQQLLAHIDLEITALDVIMLRSGLTAGELSSMLLTLELKGYVQAVTGGYVRNIIN